MAGFEFSVPYNAGLPGTPHGPEALEEVFKLKKISNNKIREIYLSGPQEYSGSGRINPKINLDEFIGIVDRIHKEGIRVNLIINTTCEGSDWYSPKVSTKTIEYLRKVHEEHGVEAVTIANPLYIKEVRRRFPDIEICASVLGDIDCVQRAVIYSKAGANTITPDVNINRDLKLLKQIKEATGAELKLMVNEGCLYKCPFRKFHFNYISHTSRESSSSEYFIPACHKIIREDPSQILKSGWIRPEDLRKYSGISSFFKIVGRVLPKSKGIRANRAYLEERWDGDILDIISSSLGAFGMKYGTYLDNKDLDKYKFFEKVTSCGQDCSQCDYCKVLANKMIRLGMFTREKMEDKGTKGLANEWGK